MEHAFGWECIVRQGAQAQDHLPSSIRGQKKGKPKSVHCIPSSPPSLRASHPPTPPRPHVHNRACGSPHACVCRLTVGSGEGPTKGLGKMTATRRSKRNVRGPTVSPGLICPLRTASSRARGMDAALVFPYSAKFDTTCEPNPTSKPLASNSGHRTSPDASHQPSALDRMHANNQYEAAQKRKKC